jgi:hypothetical protein
MPKKYENINFTPPKDVQAAARQGLSLHEAGKTGSGLEPITVTWARRIANGEDISPDKARQGNRWWGRNKRFLDFPKDSPAYAAAMLWFGRPGRRWMAKLTRQMEAADMEKKSLTQLASQIITLRSKANGQPGDDRYDYPLDRGVPLLSKADLTDLITKHAPGKHSQQAHAGTKAKGKKKAAKKPAKPTRASSILKDLPKNSGLIDTKRRNKIVNQLSELSTDELTKAVAANNKRLSKASDALEQSDSAKNDLELRNALIQSRWLEQATKKRVGKLKRQQAKAAKSDYGIVADIKDISALIEKIGARHTQNESALIQKIHDLALSLGAECHPLTRRAGARHSRGDQVMVQRIHDDCSGLGATCKAMPEKDRVYGSQVLKEGMTRTQQVGRSKSSEIIKAQSDAPNYAPASTPQRCANCRFFLGDPGRDWCELFDFTADQDYHCDAWEAQRPDEIPGYVANKADLAALTEGVLILRNSAKLT